MHVNTVIPDLKIKAAVFISPKFTFDRLQLVNMSASLENEDNTSIRA